ncbi:unnamed protein product [Cladocopium goreaui]|uniref:Uncharacterized protein n=1 Tax=Cladocopium goreaui TaxID=2562237 RepID=A0A9P1G783_9DINO|nr:unnamed protein product [Cladocopium goreaui]
MVLHRLKPGKEEMKKTTKAIAKTNRNLKKEQGHEKDDASLARPVVGIARSLTKSRLGSAAAEQMRKMLMLLVAVDAPRILLQLTSLIFMANGAMKEDIDMCEYFAGQMAVTKCFARAGFKSVPFEINLQGSAGDILDPIGFSVALCMAMRMKFNSFCQIAAVCSTWVFLSRSQTKCSLWNPLGDRRVRAVEDANEP